MLKNEFILQHLLPIYDHAFYAAAMFCAVFGLIEIEVVQTSKAQN